MLSVKIELGIPLYSIRMQLIPIIVYDVMSISIYNFHNINFYVCNINMATYIHHTYIIINIINQNKQNIFLAIIQN